MTQLEREMLAALKRAAPWLGKLIAEGIHKNTAMPNDAISTLEMVELVIERAKIADKG